MKMYNIQLVTVWSVLEICSFPNNIPKNCAFIKLKKIVFIFGLTVYRIFVARPGVEPGPAAVEAWSINYWFIRMSQHSFNLISSNISNLLATESNH